MSALILHSFTLIYTHFALTAFIFHSSALICTHQHSFSLICTYSALTITPVVITEKRQSYACQHLRTKPRDLEHISWCTHYAHTDLFSWLSALVFTSELFKYKCNHSALIVHTCGCHLYTDLSSQVSSQDVWQYLWVLQQACELLFASETSFLPLSLKLFSPCSQKLSSSAGDIPQQSILFPLRPHLYFLPVGTLHCCLFLLHVTAVYLANLGSMFGSLVSHLQHPLSTSAWSTSWHLQLGDQCWPVSSN